MFKQSAASLGKVLAQNHIELVFGGGRVGLMGVIADAVLSSGGRVTGVIPEFMDRKELTHLSLTRIVTVDTMHERKQKMAELSDGFVAMPGGFGTLEEIFEAITWTQLKIHDKPCAFYNVGGFFDGLRGFIHHASDAGFISKPFADSLIYGSDPEQLIEALRRYRPIEHDKIASILKELE